MPIILPSAFSAPIPTNAPPQRVVFISDKERAPLEMGAFDQLEPQIRDLLNYGPMPPPLGAAQLRQAWPIFHEQIVRGYYAQHYPNWRPERVDPRLPCRPRGRARKGLRNAGR